MTTFIAVDDDNRLISLDNILEMYAVAKDKETMVTEIVFVGGYKIQIADDFDDLRQNILYALKGLRGSKK